MIKAIRLSPSLSFLRSLKSVGYKAASLFVNLEAVERALLDSRILEYPFVLQGLSLLTPGRVLDLGCVSPNNYLCTSLAALGWQVYGIDTRPWPLRYPNFTFVQEDIRATSLPPASFDAVYAVSTLEHIGLAGRYGVRVDDPDGDLQAVREVARLLRKDGLFLITVPYGQPAIVRPLNRVYDRSRLLILLPNAHWQIKKELYYRQTADGTWEAVAEEEAALTQSPGQIAIALVEALRV